MSASPLVRDRIRLDVSHTVVARNDRELVVLLNPLVAAGAMATPRVNGGPYLHWGRTVPVVVPE